MGRGGRGVRSRQRPTGRSGSSRRRGAGNLVDQFAQTWLRNRIEDHPDEVRAAFGQLYTAGTVEAVDAFGEQLGSWGDVRQPGRPNRLRLVPPARARPDLVRAVPTALGKAGPRGLARPPGTPRASATSALLSLCDGLLERWGDEQPRLRDRLDAQGLGWAVLKWTPPDTWPPHETRRAAALARRAHRRGARRSRRRDLPNHGERGLGSAGRRPARARPRRSSAASGAGRCENAQDLADPVDDRREWSALLRTG